ncbi:unnamed protein product [Caenorhabditis auriculariae]|uniref:Uncharacterized protein n=1 Tax=Caenorhabditis auriculariae TaxID=2777116 RepID=A0A8S1HZX3_9PELO|nr:unnamed protein product [Caenorhabditis auriculariae]
MRLVSRLPELEIPNKTFHDYIFDEFAKYGDNVAMISNDTKMQYTYHDLMERAKYIARALVYLGVEKGEVVLLVMDNSPECIYIPLGISMAGAAVQVTSPKLQAGEMRFPVEQSESRFVFSDPLGLKEITKLMRTLDREHRIVCTGAREYAEGYPILADLEYAVNQIRPFPTIDPQRDMVYLPFSSGIHGKRKGILTTHEVMVAKTVIAQNKDHYHQFAKGDYTVTMLPFHKQMGFEAMLIALLNGVTVITEKNFCVHTMLTLVQRYKVRSVHLTPMIMGMMAFESQNHEYEIDSLEWVVSGSEAISEELFDEFQEAFPSAKNVVQTYGMTEVGLITRSDPLQKYSTSCGHLAANLELKVVDICTGDELGPNQKGQIFVKGLAACSPYLNNHEATVEHFLEGWRKTGDIGYFDENEELYIVDKVKEMIKVFGYQVIPSEIETLIMTHPAVAEAAVVAITNDVSGERPVAFVVLKPDHQVNADEIKDYVNKRVIRYKHLVQVNIAQTLPRSACGTLLRRLLAEAAVLSVACLSDIEKSVIAYPHCAE